MTVDQHRVALARLESELNQALLEAASAGIALCVATGTGPYRMGPTNSTEHCWIAITRTREP